MIHRHSGFHTILIGVGVLYSQITHQSVACLSVQLVKGNIADAHFGQYHFLDGCCYTVFLVRGGDVVGTSLHRVGCLPHGYAHAGQLKHGYVARTVADGHYFLALHAQMFEQGTQRIGFINRAGHYLQEEGFGAEYVEHATQTFLPVLFKGYQCRFVVAHQHALARGKVDGGRELFLLYHDQVVQFGFVQHMFVVRVVGQNQVIVVSKQGKAVLPGFLLQVRQHFGIDPAFEKYLSVLCIDNLATVVRQDKSTVIAQFQGFGHFHQAVRRTTRCQHHTHAHLLYLQQGRQGTLRNLLCVVQQRTVYIKNQ